VVEAGAVAPLIRLLNHSQPSVQTPALRSVGNIAAGTAAEAGAVVACGVLGMLGELLRSPKKEIRKEAAWMASNLTAGDHAQVRRACGGNGKGEGREVPSLACCCCSPPPQRYALPV
jgi:hypothetical protein